MSHNSTEKAYVVSQQYIHIAFQDQEVDLVLGSGASNEAMVKGFWYYFATTRCVDT